jgi:hypothetical protein
MSDKMDLFSSDSISGASPPSVFVGSYNYPKVFVGPMVPPEHGDTSLLDSPERWKGKTLEEIVNFRLSLVRGIKPVPVQQTEGRYIESLQEVAMASRPADSDLSFSRPVSTRVSVDGESAPFGPVGSIESARFSADSPVRQIEKAFYDGDLKAQDAVMELYDSGVEVSRIQRCFSIGMLGRERRLVPTKWSITATDDIISSALVRDVLEYPMIDSCRVFTFEHLGNVFAVVLFPHRWVYEMIEAWYSGRTLGFGSDCEDARGINHPPAIAGAYFAAKLGVAEYLHRNGIQAGAVILREIRPEYAIPVGVWQVREGIRQAMRQEPVMSDNLDHGLQLASERTSISRTEWLLHGKISGLAGQKIMSDFL